MYATGLERKIIKDARVFHKSFLPEKLVHREKHIEELRRNLEPLVNKQIPRNIFIYGPPGSGKTSTSRCILKEFLSYSVLSTYINCWENPTRFKVLFELCGNLGTTLNIHRKGTSTDQLLDRIKKLLHEKYCAVILDEVDQLENEKVLYDLSRLENTGLVLISTNKDIFNKMDSRVKSSLASSKKLEFGRYSKRELSDILRSRAEKGLFPETITEEQIEKIAERSEGDARVAVDTLRIAAEDSERNGENKITTAHIENILPEVNTRVTEKLDVLTEEEKLLYDIINEQGKIKIGNLYQEYEGKSACPVVRRTVRDYLNRMLRFNLIKSEGRGRKRKLSVSG